MASKALVVFSGLLSLCAASPVKRQNAIPQYVLDFAPLVYLHPEDPYFPSDIADTVKNTVPEVNFQKIETGALDLNNLDQLNNQGGENVYLTSTVDITSNPAWLNGIKPNGDRKTEGGTTSVVVTVDRGSGRLDAYYLYYYAYNWGGRVLGLDFLQLGNHVGDWEHNMIRFQDGAPDGVWYSQHANGQAFRYAALEKEGQRPIAYSANGSHAVFARTGKNEHTIPTTNLPFQGILTDYTEKGPLWDPLLASYQYSYDLASQTFTPYGDAPTAYLNFNGKWGDQEYPENDPRQQNLFGNPKYSGGPTGPKFKNLDRENVCPPNVDPCWVRPVITRRDDDVSRVIAEYEEPEDF